jgi:hypothetical protein
MRTLTLHIHHFIVPNRQVNLGRFSWRPRGLSRAKLYIAILNMQIRYHGEDLEINL